MSIQNDRQLKNTLTKLEQLEKLYAEARAEPDEDSHVQDLSLRSYKRIINQLKEEIALYRAHAHVATKS